MDSVEQYVKRAIDLAFPWSERYHHLWFAQREMVRLANANLPEPWGRDHALRFGPKAGEQGKIMVRLFQLYSFMFSMLWFRPVSNWLDKRADEGITTRAERAANYTDALSIIRLFNSLITHSSNVYYREIYKLRRRYPGSYMFQSSHKRGDILYLAAMSKGFATLQILEHSGDTEFYVLINQDEIEMLEDTRRPLENHEVVQLRDKYCSSGLGWRVAQNDRVARWT